MFDALTAEELEALETALKADYDRRLTDWCATNPGPERDEIDEALSLVGGRLLYAVRQALRSPDHLTTQP